MSSNSDGIIIPPGINIDESSLDVAKSLSNTFENLTKDLPEAAKVALASVVIGGALVASGFYLAKKL